MAIGQDKLGLLVGAKAEIADEDRREGLRRSLRAGELAGDYPHRCRAARQPDDGNLANSNALIARRRQFVLRRQIDPQLHHFKHPAALSEIAPMKLLMNNTRRSGHPLDVAGTDPSTAAG